MGVSLNLMKKFYEAKTKKMPENQYSQERTDYMVNKKNLEDVNKAILKTAIGNKKSIIA